MVTEKVPPVFTIILWLVAPLFHSNPTLVLAVKTVLSPRQKVVGLLAEIIGVAGNAFTVTIVGNEVDLHPFAFVFVTEKLPLVLTLILADVTPLLHTIPVFVLEVRITLSPSQNVMGLFANIVGTGGKLFTTTLVESEVFLQPFASVVVTAKLLVPVFTLMLTLVAPVLHLILFVALEVNITLSPKQKVVGLLAEIVGFAGNAFTETETESAALDTQPAALNTVKLNLPLTFTVMLWVEAPLLQRKLLASLLVSTTLSPKQKVVGLLFEIIGLAGKSFTVTTVVKEADLQPFAFVFVTVKLPLAFTFILVDVSPLFHNKPPVVFTVKVTLSPLQNVTGKDLFAEIVGTAGKLFTITLVESEVFWQPFASVVVTAKLLLPVFTLMVERVIPPKLHLILVVILEVNVTLSPKQKVVGPLAVMVGFAGNGFTLIVTVSAGRDIHPTALNDVKLNFPLDFTVMLCVVSPLLHI